MKRIKLSNGEYVKVDDQDYGWLNQMKWYESKAGYACHSHYESGRRILWYMHREIVKPGDGFITDHINFDKLDNRRCNLRVCTSSQNNAHRKLRTNRSGYVGVHWVTRDHRWRAHIKHDGKQMHIGDFTDRIEAARAYNKRAKELHGEYAMLNPL